MQQGPQAPFPEFAASTSEESLPISIPLAAKLEELKSLAAVIEDEYDSDEV